MGYICVMFSLLYWYNVYFTGITESVYLKAGVLNSFPVSGNRSCIRTSLLTF